MLAFLLIALKLLIDNNVIIDASSTSEENINVTEKINQNMQSLVTVYNAILFGKKDFYSDQRRKEAQMKIAFYFYKRECFSILIKYLIYYKNEFEKELDEFHPHFQQIREDFDEMFNKEENTMELGLMTCEFYKMFLRMNFDKILQKSEQWKLIIREKTRAFFWLNKEWQIKTENFLKEKNLNWNSKDKWTEKQCEHLHEFLAKDSQNYIANFLSLRWLMAKSEDFIKNIGKKSEAEFLEMKKRIFILTGPIGFDRLELTRMIVMKIRYPIPEFTNVCLKRYLFGKENARIYQLRMSISLLLNDFSKFRESLVENMEYNEKLRNIVKTEKESKENARKIMTIVLAKFDRFSEKIDELLSSMGDLDINDEYIVKAKALLEQTLYILLKFFEISANGEPILISDVTFAGLSEKYLLENTNNVELNSMEKRILPTFYLIEINKLLAGADKELQDILKLEIGSIYRLAFLIGGNDNLFEIWFKHREKIRSMNYFTKDFDKKIREYYEILLSDDNEKSRIISKIKLNIFLLMNTLEKDLKSTLLVLEEWRYMCRYKIDSLHIRPDFSNKIDIEITIRGNFILDFLTRMANKPAIQNKYKKENDQKGEEIKELLKNGNASAPALSDRFQNIHIVQFKKLVDEDKFNNVTKTFNFWDFFQEFSSKQDKKLKTKLKSIISDSGIEKLKKELFRSDEDFLEKDSKFLKEEEQQTKGKKSKKGKKKKKTVAGKSLPQKEEYKIDTTTVDSDKEKEELNFDATATKDSDKVEVTQKVLDKDSNNEQRHPNTQQIMHPSNEGQSQNVAAISSQIGPIPSIESEQNILLQDNLEKLLNGEWLENDVIDAYLEMLIHENEKAHHGKFNHFGFIPTYVIYLFRFKQEKFFPEWLQQKVIVGGVKYWLIPAHLSNNHWVLTVMDVDENRLHYFDSLHPGSTNNEFTRDIFKMFHDLYTQSGHPLSGQFVFSENDKYRITSRTDLPTQGNAIDCGVFILMFARDIIDQNNTNAEMHINQSGVKEARERIYAELIPHLIPGSGLALTKTYIHQSMNEDEKQKLTNLQSTKAKPESSKAPQETSNKSLQSHKLPNPLESSPTSDQSQSESSSLFENTKRLRSIQNWPLKDKEEEKEAEKLEEIMTNALFMPKSEPIDLQLYTGFFHYKILSGSILSQFDDKNNFDTEKFEKQFEKRKEEYSKLKSLMVKSVEKNDIIKEKACRFYKFLFRLWHDVILAENEKFNVYFLFRMRHFYWIDPEWETSRSGAEILTILKMEESECTPDEYNSFFSFYASPPQLQESNYWCLKWLLNNSPLFIERIQKLQNLNFMNLKLKIYDLIGYEGFYHLELAAPAVMKLEKTLGSFTVECIKRTLNGIEPERNELRIALNLLLQNLLTYHKDNPYNLEKFKEIIGRIWERLIRLTDEEYNQEEEEIVLNDAVCVLLRFHEINQVERNYTMITAKSFDEKSIDDFMNCSQEEIDTNIDRQRIILAPTYLTFIDLSIDVAEEMQEVLKNSAGSIYRLSEFIGGSVNLRNFWFEHTNAIRSRTYFIDPVTEEQLRIFYETFINHNSSFHRHVNKIAAYIYAFANWIESTVGNKYSFQNLIENWRFDFRYWADHLYLRQEEVKSIGIEVIIKSEKIVTFINKNNKKGQKQKPEQLANKFIKELKEEKGEDKLIEEPMLSQNLQNIHIEILQKIASQDKVKRKEDDKNFNFWQLFHDLHNHPEQREHIYEILDKKNIQILYYKLGLDFHDDKFPESSKVGEFLSEGKTQLKEIMPTKGKILEGEGGVKDVAGSSPKTVKESGVNKNKRKEKKKADKRKEKEEEEKRKEKEKLKQENLQKFNKEFGKTTATQIRKPLRARSTSTPPRGSQIRNEISLMRNDEAASNITGIRRNQSTGNKRNGQLIGGRIKKLNILKEYEFKDLMRFDILDRNYKKLMKNADNHEQLRFMDILVFAFEIGQRLKALEIRKKIFTDNEIQTNLMTYNEIELEKIRKEVDNIKINEFEGINELEEYLYNLLIRIENGLKNNKKLEEENKIVYKMEKIKEMRKHLHAFRFAWIIQRWKVVENKDKNRILFALNLEAGITQQMQILKQIRLDHDLYAELGIEQKRKILGIDEKEKGIEIFDLVKYSQQLYFDEQERILTENLIKELEFVDVKDIEKGEPIKYEWMKKYMKAKERVTNLIKEWHSSAHILFNGSYLLGTINSNSNLDIIVLTYNLKIDEKEAVKCIIEENNFDEHKKIQRERKCKNDKLFLCQLCKMDRVISAVKIEGYLEIVKAFICEDDDSESKSFEECQYKIEVNFLFVNIPPAVENEKFDSMRNKLKILTNKEVKSIEINKILIELYALPLRRKSFYSLLGFRDNIQMLELMPIDHKNFRIAGAAMKLWAKRNNIYGPKLGFFKGVHMNILMAKIYLRYPKASVSYLIEQFFLTYILWPWPMPVQLLPISELTYPRSQNGEKLWYNMDINKHALMPIISPGFIESNKATDIDNNTKIIMHTIMSEGLKQIREIRTGKMESGKEWSNFMRGHDLGKKYQHYLVVNCLTKMSQGSFGNDFCAIASLKMHDFIPNVIGKILPEAILWYHIIEAGSRKKCLINREGYPNTSNYKCDLWLVGLKPKKNEQIKWNELINLENSMNEASKTMYKDYFEYKQKKSKIQFGEKEKVVENLLLVTNYVAKKDLNKWNIQLRGCEVIVKDEEN